MKCEMPEKYKAILKGERSKPLLVPESLFILERKVEENLSIVKKRNFFLLSKNSSLDNHLARVFSSEEAHEGSWHFGEALHCGLPHLDLPGPHPLGHGHDPLHPPRLPAIHQKALDLQLLRYGER